ncbi:MAG: GNAT family N-acetyltransferase [Lachnospiraceae bacterium]|nr:GNAT family N-acetyltransferase [Lachnospiraceae bacterium]
MVIHKATKEDASSILRIYSYYVENTAISFEYTTPSLSEFEERISNKPI